MGLKETIASAVRSGFTALGNIPESVTYKSYVTTSVYDVTTGAYTRVETSQTLSGIFLEYSKRDIDGQQIQPHDQKFLFQQADLDVTPSLLDRIVRSTGAIWEVVWVKKDPADATWELQVRARNG